MFGWAVGTTLTTSIFSVQVYYEPLGVVAAIVSSVQWSLPLVRAPCFRQTDTLHQTTLPSDEQVELSFVPFLSFSYVCQTRELTKTPFLVPPKQPLAFHNALSPIIASLFAGNAVVLKCSEQVAWSSRFFVDGVRECLRVCGFEEDLVQVRLPPLSTQPPLGPILAVLQEWGMC